MTNFDVDDLITMFAAVASSCAPLVCEFLIGHLLFSLLNNADSVSGTKIKADKSHVEEQRDLASER
jgi:hypothetical protein